MAAPPSHLRGRKFESLADAKADKKGRSGQLPSSKSLRATMDFNWFGFLTQASAVYSLSS